MPKKDRDSKKLNQKVARCESEYCARHKRRMIAKFALTDRLHPIDVVPECPECTVEQAELNREIAMSTRKVI